MSLKTTIKASRVARYAQEQAIAAAHHAAALAAVGEFDDMLAFATFNVECGDGELWEFRSATGGRMVVNKEALTPAELARKQNAERAERVAKLRELISGGAMAHVEGEDDSITDLLDKPLYV